jgi:surface antigen
MRITASLAGVLLGCVIFVSQAPTASAQDVPADNLEGQSETMDKLAVLDLVEKRATPAAVVPAEPPKHIVSEGETLSKIAEQFQTSWKRLYDKNTQIENPDIVNPGSELVIPAPDEQLAERPVPVEEVPEPAAVAPEPKTAQAAPRTTSAARGTSSGNTYTPGYCTWYAKSRRPDLPNNLGNAYTWVSRAAAQGIPTGSAPQVGAIGQRGNHVVYVESINGNGTITISDMNYQALGVVTVRVVAASDFLYIY